MRAAFLGATKGMGRSLARLMAERGDQVCLLGRHEEDLRRSAADLEARAGGGTVPTVVCDLEAPSSFTSAIGGARDALGGLDAVIVTAGIFAPQDELEIAEAGVEQ